MDSFPVSGTSLDADDVAWRAEKGISTMFDFESTESDPNHAYDGTSGFGSMKPPTMGAIKNKNAVVTA